MSTDAIRPWRYTSGRLSRDFGKRLLALIVCWRIATWGYRRTKPVFYHPIALAGIAVVLTCWIIHPWLLLAPVLAVFAWFVGWPDSYVKHAHTRTQSFLAGFRYRWRPRPKLSACSILRVQDTIPTISHVTKIGCVTKVRVKMCWGHSIDWWREDTTRIAQTYNAGDCKIDPFRRETLIPWRHEMVTKYRWLTLEFLTRDPFTSKMGVELIDFYRRDTLEPVVAISRAGEPQNDNLAAHKLTIAMTRWGKSVRIRARIRAQRHNIKDRLLELWGIDGKGGVEQSLLKHVFARLAYGDKGYVEFDQLLRDAVAVMQRRQRRMRGFVTEHIPTPDDPWLLIVIDELLVLTSKAIPPQMRTSIAQSIMLIQQQGIACGVSLDASTQLAQKERIDFRDGFTEFEVGKVERGAVDMIFGTGWWERGARADEIPTDLRGTFYKKTDTTMAPEQIRYPNIDVADVSAKSLGFTVGKSVLWPIPKPVMPEGLPMGGDVEPERDGSEPVAVGRLTDL